MKCPWRSLAESLWGLGLRQGQWAQGCSAWPDSMEKGLAFYATHTQRDWHTGTSSKEGKQKEGVKTPEVIILRSSGLADTQPAKIMEMHVASLVTEQHLLVPPWTPCGHRTGKGQFSFQPQRKEKPKNVQTTAQLHSSDMLAKQCSKFSKWGFLRPTWLRTPGCLALSE